MEPCFGIGLSLSLICRLTSEHIKHHFIIIWKEITERFLFGTHLLNQCPWYLYCNCVPHKLQLFVLFFFFFLHCMLHGCLHVDCSSRFTDVFEYPNFICHVTCWLQFCLLRQSVSGLCWYSSVCYVSLFLYCIGYHFVCYVTLFLDCAGTVLFVCVSLFLDGVVLTTIL